MKRFTLHLLGIFVFTAMSINGIVIYGEKNGKNTTPMSSLIINTSMTEPVRSYHFLAPGDCERCHKEIYQQWQGSMHAKAYFNPLFKALWKQGSQGTNGATDKLCASCHVPIGAMVEEINLRNEKKRISAISRRGIQCDFCHSIASSSVTETPDDIYRNISVTVEPGMAKRGPFKETMTYLHLNEYSELHTKSEFCAICHRTFHDRVDAPIDRTYDEWKQSLYAEKGIQCQDCHMTPIDNAIQIGKTIRKIPNPGEAAREGSVREHIYTHEFAGSNVALPTMLKAPKHAEIAEKLLQSAATVTLILSNAAAVGKTTAIQVTVTNVGAGHNIPTGLTELRQMWLDITVQDANGKEIFRSGAVDSAGNIDEDAVIFNTRAVDKNGQQTVNPWIIEQIEYNHTIPYQKSSTEKYSFNVPQGTVGPLNIVAKLRYRSYPQTFVNDLLGEDAPILPITDMAKAQAKLPLQ